MSGAQMHGLDIGRIDEDLGKGPGLRQALHQLGVDLEIDERRLTVVLRRLEEVRPHDRGDEIDVAPDDAVLVEIVDIDQRLLDPGLGGFAPPSRSCALGSNSA